MSTLNVGTIASKTGNSSITIADNGNASIPTGKVLSAPGHIIQVVNANGNTQTTTTSTANVRVGIEAAITPKFSNSKIVVLCNATVRWQHGYAGYTALHRKIVSGSYSEIITFSRHTIYRNFDTGSTSGQHVSFNYVDSPSTTDAVTYQWAMNRFSSGTAYFLPNNSTGDSQNWTLMEIAQ